MRKTCISLFAVLALATAACGGDDGSAIQEPTGPAADIPSVEIGECVTAPDASIQPADPEGVDYNTQLKEQGKLTVGSDIAFPPFEDVGSGGEPEGFDVDLGTEIGTRLGLETEFVNTSFDALFTQSLPQGQFDVGISAITIKAERQESIDFTTPYFKADLSLAVAEANAGTTIEDLEGRVLGAQTGTTGADCAEVIRTQVGITEDVRLYDTALQAFDDLAAGRVFAVVNDLPSTADIVSKRDGIVVSQRIDTSEVYGIAIGKQKPDLRVAINGALAEMFEDGKYAEIYRKWFGVDPPFELPPG